jgi:hypothetical protein
MANSNAALSTIVVSHAPSPPFFPYDIRSFAKRYRQGWIDSKKDYR